MEFQPFPKMSRLMRNVYITEKIDGTNAQVAISNDGDIAFGSRNRWVTPENDNYGFAAWGNEHREELMALGPGRHFGEWFGEGIQRGYGLKTRKFFLFNGGRWNEDTPPPEICGVVPLLAITTGFNEDVVTGVMQRLKKNGSYAVPGYMNPEGIVMWHSHVNAYLKRTFEHDEAGKEGKSAD